MIRTLKPGTTKNREGRTFPLFPELRALLEAQRAYTERIQRDQGRIIPWVFHRRGERIRSFYDAWRAAVIRAGYGEPRTDDDGNVIYDANGKPKMKATMISHDFRRTAVRRLERAGVSRSVAKKLVGHKTDSIYERYAITNEQDLKEGVAKVARLLDGTERDNTLPFSRTGT